MWMKYRRWRYHVEYHHARTANVDSHVGQLQSELNNTTNHGTYWLIIRSIGECLIQCLASLSMYVALQAQYHVLSPNVQLLLYTYFKKWDDQVLPPFPRYSVSVLRIWELIELAHFPTYLYIFEL